MPRPLATGRPRGDGDDPFIAQIRQSFGTKQVRVIRNEGLADEESFEAEAHIQPKQGAFSITTPIYEGDIVEMSDPRGGVERRLAASVNLYETSMPNMSHTEVIWGKTAPPRVAPVRRLTFENLHPVVQAAAGDLFADGHFETAVSEAFKSIEVRVRDVIGGDGSRSGAPLMGDAFKADGSVLDVAGHQGRSGDDEREGFMHIFRGSMIGIRNPGAHELFKPGDPQQALEYLGFASLLHRRIDAAEAKRP